LRAAMQIFSFCMARPLADGSLNAVRIGNHKRIIITDASDAVRESDHLSP
jgi:hypothetical protein